MWEEKTLLIDDVVRDTGIIAEATRKGIKVTADASNGERAEYDISVSDIIQGWIAAWIAYTEYTIAGTKQ